jgi:hypothetical protein
METAQSPEDGVALAEIVVAVVAFVDPTEDGT